MRERCRDFARELQGAICEAIEGIDGGRFQEDAWERPGGGGGVSRVLTDGDVLEKGGVNFSEVHGELGEDFSGDLPGDGSSFYATGISLVLHPRNPRAPTVHANLRYIEKGEKKWFGGGSDLTPHYLYEEDAVHFHSAWKAACDLHGASLYADYKKGCDEYFYLPHRDEARGIGGIFFDYVDADESSLAMWEALGRAFVGAYLPILERRKDEAYGEAERLQRVLNALDAGQALPAHQCMLYDPTQKWSVVWQKVLTRVNVTNPPEHEIQGSAGTALHEAQTVIRGGAPNNPMGVAAMTLPVARELARFGIRVVSVAPGVFATPMMEAAPESVRESLAVQIPFPPRLGRPDRGSGRP